MHVWANGAMVDADGPHVAVDDHGLVVGDGAFETLKTVRGEPFLITRHLRRLDRTCKALAIETPSVEVLTRAINDSLASFGRAHTDSEARIRITVTGGRGSLGSGAPSGPASLLVAVTPLAPVAAPTVITVPWTRNERGALAGLKTTSYAENVMALRVAHEAGASEAIFANTVGDLCEGTGTNIFVVVDGRCMTPPLSSGCLAGTTREVVLEIADVDQVDLSISVLETADEVFLTSTTRDVQGLVRVDDRHLEVGPATERIAKQFANLITKGTDL